LKKTFVFVVTTITGVFPKAFFVDLLKFHTANVSHHMAYIFNTCMCVHSVASCYDIQVTLFVCGCGATAADLHLQGQVILFKRFIILQMNKRGE